VIVQLIDGRTDTHLFAQAFERELVDVLALQRDIAAAVARETRLTLTPEETTRLDSFPRVIPEAHEAYLLGSLHLNRTTVPDALQAVEHFEHALRLSPDYALAFAGLADARIIIAHSHGRPAADDYEPARQAAQRALELDPNLTAAAVTLGQVEAEHDWDWAEAEDRLVQAAAASPSTARVHESLADLLVNLGRDDEAVAHALRALELDPVSAPQLSNLCRVLYFAGRFEDGAARCRQAIELDHDYAVAHGYLCLCFEQLGRYDEALLAAAEANRIFAVPLAESPEVGHLHAVAGRPSEADAVLSRLRGQSPAHVPNMACALVEVGLGRTSDALDSLERAVAQREPWVVRLAVDPRLAPLRSDDRFRGLLRRVGLPEPSP
jgi:tetratricopeptide (TPR) repeat protein